MSLIHAIGRVFNMKTRWFFVLILIAGLAKCGWADENRVSSKWDETLLSVELGPVDVKPNTMAGAWEEMTSKYSLRANLYMDAAAVSDQTPFSFRREKATCKELFDAFLTTYSNFTYTHDPKTGVIWFHPKGMNFNDILSQRVGIAQGAKQVPMFTDIYLPLLNLLAHKIIDSREETPQSGMGFTDPSTGRPYIPQPWLYDVDLPAGAYSVREVLDFCCVANPTKAILVRPARPDSDQQGSAVIVLKDLIYANPLAPPRVGNQVLGT